MQACRTQSLPRQPLGSSRRVVLRLAQGHSHSISQPRLKPACRGAEEITDGALWAFQGESKIGFQRRHQVPTKNLPRRSGHRGAGCLLPGIAGLEADL